MTETQILENRRRCVEDGDLLADGPPRPASPSIARPAPMDSIETAEAVGRLKQLYRDAQRGLFSQIAFGLLCYEVKARVSHGQFGPWLEANAPKIPRRTAQYYMAMAGSSLEGCGLQINDFLKCATRCAFGHGGDFLLQDESKCPPELKDLRDKMFALLEGKTARQLCLEFKTTEELPNGDVRVKQNGHTQWDAWVGKHRPDLLVDGKAPAPDSAEPAVQKARKEFARYLDSRAPTPEDKSARVKRHVGEWIHLTDDLSRDKDLPLLPPREAAIALAVLERMAKRLKDLANRRAK